MQSACLIGGNASAAGSAEFHEDLCGFAIGNLYALAKASDIWARGLRMWNTALVGSVMMGVDDSIAEVQTRMSCSSLPRLIDLETDITPRTISRAVARFCVLARITSQLAGDSLVPLQRRVGAAYDAFGKLTA